MRAVEWDGKEFKLIDQTLLPHKVEYIITKDYRTIIDAIRRLAVRGAPAIGIAASFALAFASQNMNISSRNLFLIELNKVSDEIASSRPTARNLFWALERLKKCAEEYTGNVAEIPHLLLLDAEKIRNEDIEMCRRIGEIGAQLLPDEGGVLTHCNTGGLATGDFGTAQSIITTAFDQGKKIKVYVDETRPLLQGARLTMIELLSKGVDAVLITDNTAASLMKQDLIDVIVTGSDRIAVNGDTANKIGTYGLAVLAQYHHIPFYVAAPTSTIDPDCPDGSSIPIEERDPKEVIELFGMRIAPENSPVYSPAFDITPHNLITSIITEQGIHKPPFEKSLSGIFTQKEKVK